MAEAVEHAIAHAAQALMAEHGTPNGLLTAAVLAIDYVDDGGEHRWGLAYVPEGDGGADLVLQGLARLVAADADLRMHCTLTHDHEDD